MLSEPVVRMLFEHGAFTATDTAATAQALIGSRSPCRRMCWSKRCRRHFSRATIRSTPLLATLKGLAVAIVCGVVLGHLFGAGGIAASIALGAWSSAFSLIRRGAATFGFSIDAAARRRLPRMVAAALAMGGLLWLAAQFAAGARRERARPRAGRCSCWR